MNEAQQDAWTSAPKAEHVMTFTLDHGYVRMVAVCRGAIGAQCRLVCSGGCEQYPCEHDFTDDRDPLGQCNITHFLNADPSLLPELHTGPSQHLADRVIEPGWDGDGYGWSLATDQADQAALSPHG